MNIQNTSAKLNLARPTRSQAKPEIQSGAFESVITGESDSFSGALTGGVLAAVPAVGTLSLGVRSAGMALASGFGDQEAETLAAVGALGTLSNIAGTLTLVGGALTGNETAVNISLGLLGGSALAGAYVGAKI